MSEFMASRPSVYSTVMVPISQLSLQHPRITYLIITHKQLAGSSKTGSGTEDEDTQDLAGPAKAVSRRHLYSTIKWQPLIQ